VRTAGSARARARSSRTRYPPGNGFREVVAVWREIGRKTAQRRRASAEAPFVRSRARMAQSLLLGQAAELLGVSRRTVYYRIRDGRLRTIRVRADRSGCWWSRWRSCCGRRRRASGRGARAGQQPRGEWRRWSPALRESCGSSVRRAPRSTRATHDQGLCGLDRESLQKGGAAQGAVPEDGDRARVSAGSRALRSRRRVHCAARGRPSGPRRIVCVQAGSRSFRDRRQMKSGRRTRGDDARRVGRRIPAPRKSCGGGEARAPLDEGYP